MAEDKRKVVEHTNLNLMLLGRPHSGKSSLINSMFKEFCDGDQTIALTGRTVAEGTAFYEKKKVFRVDGSPITCETSHNKFAVKQLSIFDTCGCRFSSKLTQDQILFIRSLLNGCKAGIELLQCNIAEKLYQYVVPDNKIDVVTIVISASELVREMEIPATWGFQWLYPSERKPVIVPEAVAFIVNLSNMIRRIEKYRRNRLDTIPPDMKSKVITEIDDRIHEDNYFIMTTWQPRKRVMCDESKKAIRQYLTRLLHIHHSVTQ
mmetsp:Transcript_20849/g.23214  ORF Transcript_20849/g.23214 Transcript_20849/m.23214 type:complete len:263 (+) Transcript_20849:23-811(+)